MILKLCMSLKVIYFFFLIIANIVASNIIVAIIGIYIFMPVFGNTVGIFVFSSFVSFIASFVISFCSGVVFSVSSGCVFSSVTVKLNVFSAITLSELSLSINFNVIV